MDASAQQRAASEKIDPRILDRFLLGIETFPIELDATYRQVRSLDEQRTEMRNRILHATADGNSLENMDFTSDVTSMLEKDQPPPATGEADATPFQRLKREQGKCVKLAEEKVQIMTKAYENIDLVVRRLDANLKKYESYLRKGAFEVASGPVDRRTMLQRPFDADAREFQIFMQNEVKDEMEKQTVPASQMANHGGTVAQGAVISTEPVYCLCRKIAFGEMVACDNTECRYEWFHFACVGMDATPRGKWYCPECTKIRAGSKE